MGNLDKTYDDFSDYIVLSSSKIPDDIVCGNIDGEDRIDVYKNNLFQNLTDALKNNFPVIVKLVGEEFFNYCAEFYICSNLPKSQILYEYGDNFPEFLEHFPPAKTLHYLSDVARLELAYLRGYYAEDHDTVNFEDLAKLGNSSLNVTFTIHPKFSLMRSLFAIDKIWEFNQNNNTDMRRDLFVDVSTYLYITRECDEVSFNNIPLSEYVFLEELSRGNTYEFAIKRALNIDKKLDIQGVLLKHLLAGTFIDFKL